MSVPQTIFSWPYSFLCFRSLSHSASFSALVLWLHDPMQPPFPINVAFTPESLGYFQSGLVNMGFPRENKGATMYA